MSKRPSIAIIGAGPAGLTAANILHRHGWRFDIYESDATPTARDQGGSLDLHPEEGQVALARAGLLEHFLAVARHEDQEQRIRDFATGALLREEIPPVGTADRPEIDRQVLRDLMLAPLDPSSIHWKVRVEDVVAQPDGRHLLKTANDSLGPFDLVIGADGAWSKSRARLTNSKPVYTGITFVEVWLTDVDVRHPDLAALVGHGTLFALHGGAGLIAQRNGNATIRVYAAFRTTPEESDRPDKVLAKITKDGLLARFPGWSPALLDLIIRSDLIAAVRPIASMPAPLGWVHRPGLTLVGDAAHLMPPLGVGVNLAMLDAADFALALVDQSNWRAAQQQYEKVMLERSSSLRETISSSFDAWFGDEAMSALFERPDSP